MSEGSEIVCFHCGQNVGDPPRFNYMPNGDSCRPCAERLLESLPPIFHAPIVAPASHEMAVADEELSARDDRPDVEDDQPA